MIFLDTESTGLGLDAKLVEIGMALVRKNFTIRDRISVVITTTPYDWVNVTPVVKDMHTKNGLIQESLRSRFTVADAEARILDWLLNKHKLAKGKHPMCGSTIHGDRAALAILMPSLNAFFGYRNMDVSSFSELAKYLDSGLVDGAPVNRKLHRAIPDVEDSVAKLKYWATKFNLV